MKTPLIGISRHRLATDGEGVTTLVAFHGCPLRCRYCLNEQCLRADGVWREMDVQEILEEVMVDDLYFKATGGVAVLYQKCVKSSRLVAFKDLGPEAIYELQVQDMPLVVGKI